jgi:hypothetical protein
VRSSDAKFQAAQIGLYLGAIVTANFAVWYWGQAALPFTAFLLIPFDLVTRDVLHERWEGGRLWPKMAALIFGGSVLTALLNWDAVWVAVASSASFCAAGVINAVGFAVLRRADRLVRMNTSNFFAAIVDSVVFPIVAFGVAGTSWSLSVSQAAAKFVGGIVFSFLFVKVIWDD